MSTGPLLKGPTGSVAKTKDDNPTPPHVMPVNRRSIEYTKKLGDIAVKKPRMALLAQAKFSTPFLPSEESEGRPNSPAPVLWKKIKKKTQTLSKMCIPNVSGHKP